MNILGLDTCFDACSAAIARTGRDEVSARFEPMVTGHAERLIPMISEVMDEAGLTFGELDSIAVTFGPGTFTGTRIAVAAARSLALAAGVPLVAATSLQVMAEEVAEGLSLADEPAATDILIATDARRDEVYVQHFRGGAALCEPAVLPPAAAAGLLSADRSAVVAGSGGEAVAAAAAENRNGPCLRAIRPDLLPNARFLVRLAPRLEKTGHPVTPLYLRPADAKPQAGKSIPRVVP